VAYGLDGRIFDSEYLDGRMATDGMTRFSLAYRPVDSNWIQLNRLEYKFTDEIDAAGADRRVQKLINNWKGNYMPARGQQISLSYGIKYVLNNFDGLEYDGVTQYIGSEYRHDISEHWDFGVHASTLRSENAGNRLYSYGVSTGWNLIDNLWLSVGYNFDG